jgi:hypothetical protein
MKGAWQSVGIVKDKDEKRKRGDYFPMTLTIHFFVSPSANPRWPFTPAAVH